MSRSQIHNYIDGVAAHCLLCFTQTPQTQLHQPSSTLYFISQSTNLTLQYASNQETLNRAYGYMLISSPRGG